MARAPVRIAGIEGPEFEEEEKSRLKELMSGINCILFLGLQLGRFSNDGRLIVLLVESIIKCTV